MIMANYAKQPQATGNALSASGAILLSHLATHARARGCSGADFGRPLRATVRFLEFAHHVTLLTAVDS